MKILFICKANRFRSKSAEALFNKYNKNKDIEAKSAGVQLDILNPFVAQNVINDLKERGAKVTSEKPQAINDSLIKWADKIIITADNVNPEIFPKEKREVWPVKDASEHDPAGIKESIDDIDNRMKEFVKKINKTNL